MIDHEPYVISISRQLGSGGRYLGQRLSSRFKIHYVDREIVSKAADYLQVDEGIVDPMDEKVTPVWQSILRSFDKGRPELSYVPPINLPFDDDVHHAESEVIKQIADNCSSVIVGRGASFVLRNNPRHLAVFLYADVDFRIKRIKEIYHLSNDDAVKMIEASDRDRKRYLSNITGIDWNDTRQYHLSLDTSVLGFPLVEDIIADCLLARFGISSPELEPFNEGH